MNLDQLVILSPREQEYLVHALEAALPVRDARQFFLWTQGQMQSLLPHQILVCLQFGAHNEVLHSECLHSVVLDPHLRCRLSDRDSGLALRLARYCRDGGASLPAMLDHGPDGTTRTPLLPFRAELQRYGVDNVLLHGSEPNGGSSTVFVLFGLPQRPRARQAYFLELLLPYLHQLLLRVGQQQVLQRGGALQRPVSAREAEVLHWVREGKSNDEIGQILGISGLTVKNHLQRLYRLLGVSNRAHAIARGTTLRLFEQR
ncbi:MAG: XrtB/PEP-CTERM-associated transcriptional regulator EpsA [Sphingomonadaceae bacterium]